MLRSSKRSTSTPRLHHVKRSATPSSGRRAKHAEAERPAWDDTHGDLSKYKATPEQIARRKTQRVSKNMVTMDSLRLSMDGLSQDQSYAAPLLLPPTSTTSPAPPTAPRQPTPEPATSPSIDYGAVLKLLQKPSPNHSTSASLAAIPEKASGLLNSNKDDTWRGDQMAATSRWAAGLASQQPSIPECASPADMRHLLRSCDDEVLDATLGSFSRMDMTAMPVTTTRTDPAAAATHAETSTLPQAPTAAAYPPSALTGTAQARLQAAIQQPSQQPANGGWQGTWQQQEQVLQPTLSNSHTSQAAAGHAAHDLGAAAAAVKQRALEVQVSQLEVQVQRLSQQQQQQQPGLAPPALQQLQELKQVTSQLQSEQARLQAELTEFTQHAGSMLSRLQAQMQQLLQPAAGVAPPVTSMLQAPPYSAAPSTMLHQSMLWGTSDPHSASGSASRQGQPLPQHPSRSLFTDLHPAQGSWQAAPRPPAPQQHQQHPQHQPGLQSSPGSPTRQAWASLAASKVDSVTSKVDSLASKVPVSNFDEQLSLPSYAAMRRSTAGATAFTPSGSAVKGQAAGGAMPSGSTSRQPDDVQVQRSLPAHYQPRALGTSPVMAGGLPVPSISNDLSYLGTQLPTTRMGMAQVGGLADYERGPAPGGPIRGTSSMFGVLPEPMVFNMASDFKIVRVGGAGGSGPVSTTLTPENSLSLAAHTAAAMRGKGAR